MPKSNNKKSFKKRSSNKGRDTREERTEYKSSKCPGNDFEWYNKNPELLTSASALIFSKKYGDLYKSLSYTGTNYTMNDTGNRSVVGVMRATYYPFVTAQGTDADAINIAAKNLQTWLRHKNTGAKVYEQSDLVQVLLSTGSIKAALEYLKKILRCVASYSAVNRFAMRHILPFSDSEFSNIVDNIANYTGKLNLVIAKASSLIIPSDIPLFSRWKWLSANVFKDDQLAKCSFYTFQPEIIWHWDWANHKCTEQSFLATTFTSMLTIVENEINNLLAYEDYGTITGDITKVYENRIDITTEMALGEIQDATYDPEAVQQFKNMIVTSHTFNYEIDQVSGNSQLVYTKCLDTDVQTKIPGKWAFNPDGNDAAIDEGFVYLPKLSVSSDQPSVVECVEQTRFSAVIKTIEYKTSTYCCYLPAVGSEVITGLKCIYFSQSNFASPYTREFDTLQFADNSDGDAMYQTLRDRLIISDVTGYPQYCIITFDNSNLYCVQSFSGDNITVLDEEYLNTIHDACLLSEWTMPMFSSLKTK